MRRINIFEALLFAAVIKSAIAANTPSKPPPYLDIETFFKRLGQLWIIEAATANAQVNTACKLYDVTSVKNGNVYFGRIFYWKGKRAEKRLTGRLSVDLHPIVASLMKYQHVMRVSPSEEYPYEERLLYQSPAMDCGVFNVRSLRDRRLHILSEFYELRLWNSSAVSPYKDCLKAYAALVPSGNVITTYYNPLCKNIVNGTT
ncbi:uncharacterized protein LOC125946889 [Dermacentor silvarum]|uniref:uncharacterized protein LOC125946889 n=1 Tax=Dermacentor silvarum TaxID=543639 RepID=UPI0021019A9E|nr:uncharacterized protein LOC125946889 [Dermacentor silvarum]XP_049527017.1 uncharacterized protein LOC125946889 [Dermacentor silvarum]